MSAPIRALPVLEQWDCRSCGICCRGHTVFLERDDLDRLQQQKWNEHPEYTGTPTVVRVGLRRQPVLAQRSDGSCVFLTPDGLCKIHADHGEQAKPWACRMFPFQLIPVDDQLRLTMRRNCPSAAANVGRPVIEHLETVRALRDYVIPSDRKIAAPKLVGEVRRSWRETRFVLDAVERILTDNNTPLVRRFVHGLGFVAMLEESKGIELETKLFRNFVRASEESAGEGHAQLFEERLPPSKTAGVLFRQTAAEYVRFHPNLGDRPPLWRRWRLLLAAFRIARGKGTLPQIHPSMREATFEALEQPLGPLPADVLAPINGFFEAMAASTKYCGAGHFGWTIVDGFRAMALAYAASLWALRWIAHDRLPTGDDAVNVICMIDRSHHNRLLAGRRHRSRVEALARRGDLERLAVWYSR